jgi:hypothetical protein
MQVQLLRGKLLRWTHGMWDDVALAAALDFGLRVVASMLIQVWWLWCCRGVAQPLGLSCS